MIKSVYEKWSELKEKAVDKTNNYVATYYLGKDSKANVYFGYQNDRMGIYLEFTKEVLADLEVPSLKGMSISVVDADFISSDKKYIFIENISQNEDIFESFSSSLTDSLSFVDSYYGIYEALKNTVKDYKDYFANPNPFLTKQEEQGLCAELLELSNLIDLKGQNVVYNWQGPSKNKRDFVFDNSALEIKSTLSQENTCIKISNENQLDSSYPSSLKALYLKVYVMEDSETGLNVNSCIDEVLGKLTEISAKSGFLCDLLKLKIKPNVFKAKYSFSIQKELVYLVTDDMPKITSANLSPSIFDVSYRLKINDLEHCLISEDEMNGML